MGLWFRVEGSRFRVWDLGVGVSGYTTLWKATPVILHGVVSPDDRNDLTQWVSG